jgi:hypothetical protein
VNFRLGNATLRFSPWWESVIAGDRQDFIHASGFSSGGVRPDGKFFLTEGDLRLEWTPYWFKTNPEIVDSSGERFTLTYVNAGLDVAPLAHVVLHEMGHNLGLCHLDLTGCVANLSGADRANLAASAMLPGGSPTQLAFLPSEWSSIGTYLACPPGETVALVARSAPGAELIKSKYDYSLRDILSVDVRACGDFASYPRDLAPDPNPVVVRPALAFDRALAYVAPTLYAPPGELAPVLRVANSDQATVTYAAGSALAALGAGALWGLRVARGGEPWPWRMGPVARGK